MPFYSKKAYNHSIGLSCVFRQHRAKSHCRFLHGYALKVEVYFACKELDENGWVQDFGGLKELKSWLEMMYDHKIVVARDDPELPLFIGLVTQGLAEVSVLDNGVGCEAFAKHIYDYAEELVQKQSSGRVFVMAVTVSEHEGNSAVYSRV